MELPDKNPRTDSYSSRWKYALASWGILLMSVSLTSIITHHEFTKFSLITLCLALTLLFWDQKIFPEETHFPQLPNSRFHKLFILLALSYVILCSGFSVMSFYHNNYQRKKWINDRVLVNGKILSKSQDVSFKSREECTIKIEYQILDQKFLKSFSIQEDQCSKINSGSLQALTFPNGEPELAVPVDLDLKLIIPLEIAWMILLFSVLLPGWYWLKSKIFNLAN